MKYYKLIIAMLFVVSRMCAMDNDQEAAWSFQALREQAIAEQSLSQAQKYTYYCLHKNPIKPELAVVLCGEKELINHVALYNADTFERMGHLHLADRMSSPICVAYSPDGKLLAIGDASGYLRLVNCSDKSMREVATHKVPDATVVEKLAWSANSAQLATTVTTLKWLSDKTHVFELSRGKTSTVCHLPAKHLQFHPTQIDRLLTLYTCVAMCGPQTALRLGVSERNNNWKGELNTDFQPSGEDSTSFCISADGQCCAYAGADCFDYPCKSCGSLQCAGSRKEYRGWIEFECKKDGPSRDRVTCDLGETDDEKIDPKIFYVDSLKQFVCCYGTKVALYTHGGVPTNWMYVGERIKDCEILSSAPKCLTLALLLKKRISAETWLEKVQLMLAKDTAAKPSKNEKKKSEDPRFSTSTSWWNRLKKKM